MICTVQHAMLNRRVSMSSKVKVVSDAVQDIPHGALLVELTPDGKERCLDC